MKCVRVTPKPKPEQTVRDPQTDEVLWSSSREGHQEALDNCRSACVSKVDKDLAIFQKALQGCNSTFGQLKARALTLDPTTEAEKLGKDVEDAIALIPANLSKPSNKPVR